MYLIIIILYKYVCRFGVYFYFIMISKGVNILLLLAAQCLQPRL